MWRVRRPLNSVSRKFVERSRDLGLVITFISGTFDLSVFKSFWGRLVHLSQNGQ